MGTGLAFAVDRVAGLEMDGRRRFEYIERRRTPYEAQRDDFEQEFGVLLPDYRLLGHYGDRGDVRALCKRVHAVVKFADTSYVEFEFLPGFLTDLASVPRAFRGFVDNDDDRLVLAVLIHDYLFSTHGLPFAYANELLYQVARQCGYPRRKAWLALVSVSSPVGLYRWRKNTRRGGYSRQRAQMLLPRPVKIDGKWYGDLPLVGDRPGQEQT